MEDIARKSYVIIVYGKETEIEYNRSGIFELSILLERRAYTVVITVVTSTPYIMTEQNVAVVHKMD